MNRREMITAALASAGLATVDVKRLDVSPDDVAIVVTGLPFYKIPEARKAFRQYVKDALRGTAAEHLKVILLPAGADIQILGIPEGTMGVKT